MFFKAGGVTSEMLKTSDRIDAAVFKRSPFSSTRPVACVILANR